MLKTDLAARAASYASHWEQVETALGRAVLLPDSTKRATFAALATELKTAQTTVITRTNDLEGAQGTRDRVGEPLQDSAALFTAFVRASVPGSPFIPMLPKIPTKNAAAIKWEKILIDLSSIWERLDDADASTYPALSLPALTTLRDASSEIKQAQAALRTKGKTAKDAIVAYRALVRTLFPAGHPLRASLP
jgi:hypothetical protein